MKANKLINIVVCVLLAGASVSFYSVYKINNEKPYTSAEQVNVRVLSQTKVQSIIVSPLRGKYQLQMDGSNTVELSELAVVKVTLVNDSIEVKTFETNYGKCKTLKFYSLSEERILKVKSVIPERKQRFFDDHMIISIDTDRLKLVNHTNIDKYIAGVSEAEAGSHSTVEFYKVQSILARTYALAHIYKHTNEGYNLCDQVHCQAFYGKSNDAEILEAVAATKELVVVDDNLQLITAVFHSNSGGQTVNSEDVWGTKTSYLRSVTDTFSLKMPNAKWERKMPMEDWLTYLKLKHNYPIEDSSAKINAIQFSQPSRKINLEFNGHKVPLKIVRTDLQLKSTFFNIEPAGDSVIFRGRGFGHGIGMCQEGAMRMTKLGYDYKTVLKFYYQKINIISLKEMNFFRE